MRGAAFVTSLALMAFFVPHAYAEGAIDPGVPDPLAIAGEATVSTDEIVSATAKYESEEVASAVALVEAVSVAETASFEGVGPDLVASSVSGVQTVVTEDGALDLTAVGMPDIRMTIGKESGAGELAGGAVVFSDGSSGATMVTRPTETGVQVVAVLNDELELEELKFEFDLSAGARLEGKADGSIDVIAPMPVRVAAPGEEDRVLREIEQILGEGFDYETGEVDNALVDQLDAIQPVQTVVQQLDLPVASFAAPWAVDAEGQPLVTYYELDGGTVRQVIRIDDDTAFPVIADPDFKWYVQKALSCVASLATYAVGAAKLLQIGTKVVKALRAGKAGSAINSAYKAWLKLGADDGERLANFLWNLKQIATLVSKHGLNEAKKMIAQKGGALNSSWLVVTGGASVITDLIGVKDCVSFATGK